MASVTLLTAVLCLTLTAVQGELVITGCVNSYIRLQCPSDETLHVRELGITKLTDESPDGPCPVGSNSQQPPPVPDEIALICSSPSKCFYEEEMCTGKSDCAFYLNAGSLDTFGKVRRNTAVTIIYDCSAGASRIGGVIGICIVTFGLLIVMVVTAAMLCRRSGEGILDESKYVEFENRPSRTGSFSSEISAKIKDKNENQDRGAVGGAEEANMGGVGVRSSTTF